MKEIDSKIAATRLEILQNLHKQILEKKAKNEINKIHKVMIENIKDSASEGRSDNGRLITIKDTNLSLGGFYDVVITNNENGSLFGKVVR